MSLRVWLPLNGSLENRGLENVTITVNGTTSYTSGKIGQCLSCNGRSFWNIVGLTLGTEATIAYWSKTTVASKMSWVLLSTASDKLNLYESGIYTLNIGDSNNNPFKDSNGNTISVLNDGEWHHFAIVFGTTKVKLYIDGEYRGTSVTYRAPTTTSAKTIRMGGGYNNAHSHDWNGGLNDFRVYDHALSEQEIKKIAQGLIVHYPLNRNGWGQDNLLTNTGDLTKWIKESGISVAWDSDVGMYKMTDSSHTSSRWGIYQQITLSANTKYTLSVEGMKVNQNLKFGIGEGTSFPPDRVNFSTTKERKSYTITIGESDASCRIYLNIAPVSGGTNYGYFNLPKLELGEAETTWCPNSSDTSIMALNLNSTTVYDISGFGNNGTIHGTFSYITDTPLYKISTSVIGSGSNYLEGIVLPAEAKTVSLWIKCAKSVSSAIFNDKTTGLQIGLLNSLIYTNSKSSTAGFTTSHWINNDWNHVVVINDNGTRRCYVNGQPETQSGGSNYYIHNADNFWVWNRSYNNSYPYKGALSDLRIYTTALSADEVKELYEHRNNI